MNQEMLCLVIVFILIGNINIEIGKFKLSFDGAIWKMISAIF
ncbi:hypothetical protein [uncultured Clostridium sp.]|nr:hypothetical protein [uncultured Clostridium sp.]